MNTTQTTITVYGKDGATELPVSDLRVQAYRALAKAAERMGRNNYAGLKRYRITPEHEEVIKAMSDVLSGKITPDEAMALIGSYDVTKQRLGH